MTLDVRGSLKNTKLSKNPYVVFEEMLSNAIDSFLIRGASELSAQSLAVDFELEFFSTDLLGAEVDVSIKCTDNGFGLGDKQTAAFVTKDTSYKDDLGIPGIGKCKGSGRVQYFHHFSVVEIDSTFADADGYSRRRLEFSEPQKQIQLEDFRKSQGSAADLGTTIFVSRLKPKAFEQKFSGEDLRTLFSTKALKDAMLVAFLQRFVSLSDQLGEFKITFKTIEHRDAGTDDDVTVLEKKELPKVSQTQTVSVTERDPQSGDTLPSQTELTISHYKLNADDFSLPKNAIAFCAKASPVKEITSRYLRTKTEQHNAVGGFNHIVLIQGDILDAHVNEQRDDFDGIPEEIEGGDMFATATVSYEAIFDAIDNVIEKFVSPPNWKREKVVQNISEQFGLSEAMLSDTDTRVVYGDTPKDVVERVLKKYQKRIIDDTAEIFDLKEEILQSEPDSEEFRSKINDLSWKYTASLKSFDMANLSQLIVRRAAIVEVLELACEKKLIVQSSDKPGRRKDERLIHSIFFPMRKDSKEVEDHDIWLLNEEYHYYGHIASDKPLAQIEWEENVKLFDPDIDEAFESILKRRTDENSAKRPDIALFSEEGSAIVIEFKSPGVSMDDHIGDLSEYAHLLAAKSNNRLKKIYGYLIGDTVNPLRMSGWTGFPTGEGFFRTSSIDDPASGRNLGELYSEVIFYSDVIERARKRIGVYQDKLTINLS